VEEHILDIKGIYMMCRIEGETGSLIPYLNANESAGGIMYYSYFMNIHYPVR